jgi:hypothetical protein
LFEKRAGQTDRQRQRKRSKALLAVCLWPFCVRAIKQLKQEIDKIDQKSSAKPAAALGEEDMKRLKGLKASVREAAQRNLKFQIHQRTIKVRGAETFLEG